MKKKQANNMRKDVMICRCEEVQEGEIVEAINSGARTISGIKRRTRAGMGLCKGSSCEPLLRRLLAQATGQSPGELKPPTIRPPLRAIELEVLKGKDK